MKNVTGLAAFEELLLSIVLSVLTLSLVRHKTRIECNSSVSRIPEHNLSLTIDRVCYSFARGRERQ